MPYTVHLPLQNQGCIILDLNVYVGWLEHYKTNVWNNALNFHDNIAFKKKKKHKVTYSQCCINDERSAVCHLLLYWNVLTGLCVF